MFITNSDISDRYTRGVNAITNIAYNKYGRDLYGIQYRRLKTERKILLLLTALSSWDNRPGAPNVLTLRQMQAVMSHLVTLPAQDPDSDNVTSADTSVALAGQSNISLTVLDTSTIDLSYSNNELSAQLKVSTTAGNRATVNADGLYVSSSADTITKLLTQDNFDAGTNRYTNTAWAGKNLLVWHRGLGYLLYNAANPSDTTNEISIQDTGGFTITIPGFNVHDGTNYFYVTITDYA